MELTVLSHTTRFPAQTTKPGQLNNFHVFAVFIHSSLLDITERKRQVSGLITASLQINLEIIIEGDKG